ncbi:MAG: 6-carboxytetrahydropterin synthase [Proteobacteria bacterium]|nr:6-carboxytetrahydropterin synthase [Pseudomonadota bacterium]
MYVFRAEEEICSSHQEAEGPFHGHNFRIVALVEADELGAGGRVLDRGALRSTLKDVVEPIDHRHLNDLAPFQDRPPTPAVMAEWVGGQLAARLAGVRIRRIEVWTSPTAYAGWEP